MNLVIKFIVSFFLIFGWRVISFIEIPHLISLTLLVVHRKISKKAKNLLILFIPAFFYITLIGFYAHHNYGVYPFDTILRILRLILMIIGIDIFTTKYIKSKKELYNIIFYSLLSHSILMIAMFINSGLREFIYSITGAYEIVNNVYPFLSGLRISGLTYGLAITSVLQSYLCLYSIYNPLKFNIISRVLVFLISLISMAISGKSGFVILAVILLFYLLSSEIRFKSKFIFILITIMVVILLISYLSFSFEGSDWLISSNSELLNLIETGNSKTSDSLSDMYFFPEGLNIIFGHGTGNRFIFNEYLAIDPGFVRWIWAFGILGSLFLYLPFFKIIKDSVYLKNNVLLLIVVSLFILHFKEDTLFVRVNFYLLIMIYFFLIKNLKKIN